MPCGSSGGGTIEVENPTAKRGLCAVLSVLESRGELEEVFDAVDWKEAGVSREKILKWWNRHKREDRERRLEERKERQRKQLEKAALAKLSPDELKALGLQYRYEHLLIPKDKP